MLLLYTIARKLDFTFEKFVSLIRVPSQQALTPQFLIVIAWFPWDLSLAWKRPLVIRLRMSYMDQVTSILDDCCIIGDSILRWWRCWIV